MGRREGERERERKREKSKAQFRSWKNTPEKLGRINFGNLETFVRITVTVRSKCKHGTINRNLQNEPNKRNRSDSWYLTKITSVLPVGGQNSVYIWSEIQKFSLHFKMFVH